MPARRAAAAPPAPEPVPLEKPASPWWDAAGLTMLVTGLALAGCVAAARPVGEAAAWPGLIGLMAEARDGLAGVLTDALGLGVVVLLIGWAALTANRLAGASWWGWMVRLFGWLLLTATTATLADLFLHEVRLPWPVTTAGPGGTIGAWLTLMLTQQFHPIGQGLVAAGALLLGLTLAADRFLSLSWQLLTGTIRLVLLTIATVFGTIAQVAAWLGGATPAEEPVPPAEADATPVMDPRPRTKPATPPRVRSDVPITRPAQAAPLVTTARGGDFELPSLDLLEDPKPFPHADHDAQLRDRAALLDKTFVDFGLAVKVVGIHTGPVVTLYEVSLETGLRLNRVTVLADDLALKLSVPSVRIVAPLPGKNTVGIEVPNAHRAEVRLKELITSGGPRIAKSRLPLLLGTDTEGRSLIHDLADMPHLLIAGTTGTGKSVCLNALILSLLLMRRPDECRLLMIDPKQVEFTAYTRIPHLMHPVVTDPKKAEAVLAWAVDKMEERYELFRRARVKNIGGFNELGPTEVRRRLAAGEGEGETPIPDQMPYIVMLIDEVGDLMAAMKKEVEGHIIRLAQKSRAAGIHLILATQKPTVDVITGLIKSNLPARLCFRVSSRTDSRVVLDEMGAEKLLGKGDMLFLPPGTSTLLRAQGAYCSEAEIERVVEHLDCDPEFEAELMQVGTVAGASGESLRERLRARDDLYEQAIEVVVREGRGSVSLLQRALGIGYGRAARLIDFMAEDGIVGHYNGSQARDVLYTPEQWQSLRGGGPAEADDAA